MTTFGSPRAQIARLRQDIQNMQQAQIRQRQQLERDCQQQISSMEQQLRQEMQRQARETEAAHARRLQQLQSELLRKHREEIDRLEEFDRRAQAQLQGKLAQLNRLNQELQEEMRQIRDDADRQQEVERRTAEEEYRKTEDSMARCEATSHAFFKPGELELHRNQAFKALQMITQGMYGAGMATAVSVCTDVDILIINVQQLEQEWLRLLSDYEQRIRRLRGMLADFVKERHETAYTRQQQMQGHLLNEELLNLWSSGMYGPLCREIEEAANLLEDIRRLGVPRYLKQDGAMQRQIIAQRISRCRELEDRLTALMVCVRSELRLSDDRYVIGEMTAEALARDGYTVTDQGFRITERGEDPLDAYEVEAELTDGAVIRVTFSPVRQHGVAVRNECSVSVSLARLASEDVRSTIVLKWQNQIAQMIEAAQVGAMPILAQQAEQQARKTCSPPSPETYARRVAMKYGPNGTEGGMQT